MKATHLRLLATCLLAALLATGAAGCGLFVESQTDTPAQTNDAPDEAHETVVALYATGRVQDELLTVRGTVTVPDGAFVVYEVGEPSIQTSDGTPAFVVGEAIVTDEEFAFEVPVEGWPDEGVNVWVAFQTLLGTDAEQPAEVIEMYGKMGEYIRGDVVMTQTTEGVLRWVETEFRVAR